MSRSRPDSPALNPLVVLAGVILILYFARAVLIPLALALTLNFLLTPMVHWFQKLGVRRMPAVALVMLISVSVVAGMGWVVADQLLEVANDLPKYRLHIHNKIEALHFPPDSALGRAADSVAEVGKEFDSGPTPATPPAGLTPQSFPSQNRFAAAFARAGSGCHALPPAVCNISAKCWVKLSCRSALPAWFSSSPSSS